MTTSPRVPDDAETAPQPALLWLKASEVHDRLNVGRRQGYALMKQATFPAPRVFGPKTYRWSATEIDAWANAQVETNEAATARRSPAPAPMPTVAAFTFTDAA